MSCLIWKPRKQAYMLYLEHVPVMSHTDFSPLNERYNLVFWQISIGNELQKLLFGSKHNREQKNTINRLLKHWFEGYVWIYASVPHWKTHIPRKWYKSGFLAITFEVYNGFWKLMTLWIQYQNTQCFKQEKDTNSWCFNCKNEKNCKTSVWDIVWRTTLTFFRR